MDPSQLESSDPLRTAVAPRRLEILELIWDEELPVSAIASELPVSVPAVSQHLAKLRDAGLVAVRKEGRRRYYRAAHESMGEVSELLRPLLGRAETPDTSTAPPVAETEAPVTETPPPVAETNTPVGAKTAPTAADARSQAPEVAPSSVLDDMTSWYRQGLGARVVALRAARDALGQGESSAGASVRRIARSLTRSSLADRFPEVARSARSLEGEPDEALTEAAGRLIGALSQEAARDDRRIARILLVEDSRVEAALTRSIVSGPNREVVWATSAEEAQRIVDRQEVDLIILDLGLTGEDGRALLGRLGRRPLTAAIPVILLTGRTDVQTRTEVMSLGADVFFEKPADRALLSTAVAMMLERSAEARQAGRQDLLTGLSNRTVFLSEVRKTASSAVRSGAELTLAILDTERLAAINDIHGSEVGDLVVRRIAGAIQRSFRDSDNVARWGGGKFAVLFSNTDEEGAAAALRKLQVATDASPVTLPDGTELTPRWHAGVAKLGGTSDLDPIIARATRRLESARGRATERIIADDDVTSGVSRHIVVVEDDEILADLIRHRLEREDFEVTHFADGREALNAMTEISASTVILDVMLPGADGFEILRRLRESPSLAGVPVIVLTFGAEHDAHRAFELGADDALAKPFSVKELVTRVARLVGQLEGGSPHG